MNLKQKKELEKAFDIIQELKFEQEEKQNNLESANLEHLPNYEKVVEEFCSLEEIEELISQLADSCDMNLY
tara:strand:- start:599 stop:811 length:213 start_codon:yes stop_codon:yes gene_type:complete